MKFALFVHLSTYISLVISLQQNMEHKFVLNQDNVVKTNDGRYRYQLTTQDQQLLNQLVANSKSDEKLESSKSQKELSNIVSQVTNLIDNKYSNDKRNNVSNDATHAIHNTQTNVKRKSPQDEIYEKTLDDNEPKIIEELNNNNLNTNLGEKTRIGKETDSNIETTLQDKEPQDIQDLINKNNTPQIPKQQKRDNEKDSELLMKLDDNVPKDIQDLKLQSRREDKSDKSNKANNQGLLRHELIRDSEYYLKLQDKDMDFIHNLKKQLSGKEGRSTNTGMTIERTSQFSKEGDRRLLNRKSIFSKSDDNRPQVISSSSTTSSMIHSLSSKEDTHRIKQAIEITSNGISSTKILVPSAPIPTLKDFTKSDFISAILNLPVRTKFTDD